MNIADELVAASRLAAERVLRLWRLVTEGAMSVSEFTAAAAALIAAEGQAAAALTLSDFALAHLDATGNYPTVPTPVIPAGSVTIDVARVDTTLRRIITEARDAAAPAAAELLGDAADPAVKIQRLARAEVARSGQENAWHAIGQNDACIGWVRQTDGNACELCRWWARNGRVFGKSTRMPSHPGCGCTPRPVFERVGRAARQNREQLTRKSS